MQIAEWSRDQAITLTRKYYEMTVFFKKTRMKFRNPILRIATALYYNTAHVCSMGLVE